MRIGIISSGTLTDRIPPEYGGGIQKYVWTLGRELNNLGHEVHIFTCQQHNQLKEERIDGIHIHRTARLQKTKNFATLIFGFKTLLKIFKIQKEQGRFHIIHAQSRVSGFMISTFLPRIPFISTAHNWDIALTSPGTLLTSISYAILWLIEKRVYVHSDKIIALTHFFQQHLIQRYKIPAGKIQVIPNLINVVEWTDIPKAEHLNMAKRNFTPFLLFVGRLEKEKGLEFLLKTFKIITYQNKTLNLVIIGGGSLKNKLIEMRTDSKFQDIVRILGNISEKHLFYLLKTAEALVLPSRFEIMPTVVLEAWAAGCPVIVNKYCGVEELIRDRQTGLLFQMDQPNQFYSLIQELLSNQELKLKLIQNAKKQVDTAYNSSLVVKTIIDLYQKLVKIPLKDIYE